MTDLVRVAVVGAGAVARAVHLPILTRRSDRFAVVGICDLAKGPRELAGERFGIPEPHRFETLDAMLAAVDADGLMVLTSGSHTSAVVAGLSRGIAVFSEKPLAYTLRETAEIAAAVEGRSDRVMVGYMKAYDPAVERAGHLTRQRERPRSVEVNVFHPPSETQLAVSEAGPPPSPLGASMQEGLGEEGHLLEQEALGPAADTLGHLYRGVLLGSLSHDLSVLRALGTPVDHIHHAERWGFGDEAGSVAVLAASDNGARISLRWHYLDRYPEYREEVRWHDERGSIELVFPSPYLLHAPTTLTVTSTDADTDGAVTHRFRSPVEAFERELLAFHAMIVEGAPPRDGIEEGRTDIVVCQRIAAQLAATENIDLGGEAAATHPLV